MFERKHLNITFKTRAAVMRLQRARGDYRKPEWLVEDAFLVWIDKITNENPEVAQAETRGYQWKSLFLPEGTRVRFEYKRETYYADVRGDRLIYMGRPYSPRQLLLHVTGTVRNAWRELWLRSPGDFRWHLADTRRLVLRREPTGRHPRGVDVASHNDMNFYRQLAERERTAAGRNQPVPASQTIGAHMQEHDARSETCPHASQAVSGASEGAGCDSAMPVTSAHDADGANKELNEAEYFLAMLDQTKAPDSIKLLDHTQALDRATPLDHAMPFDQAAPLDQAMPFDHAMPFDQAAPLDQATPFNPAASLEQATPLEQAHSLGRARACDQTNAPGQAKALDQAGHPGHVRHRPSVSTRGGERATPNDCAEPAQKVIDSRLPLRSKERDDGTRYRSLDASSRPAPESLDPPAAAQLSLGGISIGNPPYRYPCAVHGASLRAILYRDDVVRDDQPDLSTGGGGRAGAGRSGPRDRRWTGYLAPGAS